MRHQEACLSTALSSAARDVHQVLSIGSGCLLGSMLIVVGNVSRLLCCVLANSFEIVAMSVEEGLLEL